MNLFDMQIIQLPGMKEDEFFIINQETWRRILRDAHLHLEKDDLKLVIKEKE